MSQQWTAGKITTEMFPQPRHLIPGKSRKAQCLEGAHGQDGGWDWGWQEWDEGPYTDFLGCWRMHVWNTSYSRVCDKGLCSFQALQRPSRVSTFCSTPIESSLLGCGHWREELCPHCCVQKPQLRGARGRHLPHRPQKNLTHLITFACPTSQHYPDLQELAYQDQTAVFPRAIFVQTIKRWSLLAKMTSIKQVSLLTSQ